MDKRQTGNYLRHALNDLYDHFDKSWGKVEVAINLAAIELNLLKVEKKKKNTKKIPRPKLTIITRKKLPILAKNDSENFNINLLIAVDKVMKDIFDYDLTSMPILFPNKTIADALGAYRSIDILFGTRFTNEFYGQAASRLDICAITEFMQARKLTKSRIVLHDVIRREIAKDSEGQSMQALITENNMRSWNKLIEDKEPDRHPVISIGSPFIHPGSEKILSLIFDVKPYGEERSKLIKDGLPKLPIAYYFSLKTEDQRDGPDSSFHINRECIEKISDSNRYTVPLEDCTDHLCPKGGSYTLSYPPKSDDPNFDKKLLEIPGKVVNTNWPNDSENHSSFRRAIIYGSKVLINNKRDELRSDLMKTNVNYGLFIFRRMPDSGRIVGCLSGCYGPTHRALAELVLSNKAKFLLPDQEVHPTVLIGLVKVIIKRRKDTLPKNILNNLTNMTYKQIGYDIRTIHEKTLISLDLWQKKDDENWVLENECD